MALWLPTETTEDERARAANVAILPIGSFEQHGPYLPLTTDTLVASIIAGRISDIYTVLHLPPITISCSHEHNAWPGTVSISARTLYGIIADIRDSLQRSGVEKLVLINGHGGNYVLRNVAQEANVDRPSVAIFPSTTDWINARKIADLHTTDHQDMHAGELETSILLCSHPELVRDGYQSADNLTDSRPRLLTHGMQEYTISGIIGRPSMASAEKGELLLSSLVDAFANCIQAIAS